MRVAIVYDRVNKFGGAERVLLALHEIFPKAPLFTSVYSEEKAGWANVFPEIRTSFLQKIPFVKTNHELVPFLMPMAFELFDVKDFDLVISVTSEFAKNINVRNGTHICYCLTPTRYLWSHHADYFGDNFLRKFMTPMIFLLRQVDKRASKKPDIMIAISSSVQKRIKKYYGRDAKIIFPPVDVGKFASHMKRSKERYFLIVSRLVKYKRVDLAIEAFNELGLPLVIIGTGREEKKLRKIAKENVSFLGSVSDKKVAKYYADARAFIMPQEEDFGLTAVEAHSFGVPVIAYKAGGALDSVTKSTGVFFEKQDKESLVNAIKKFERMKFERKVVRRNAERFSKEKFKREFLQLVKRVC